MGTSGWTDERVEKLKKMWAEGLSASQCAIRLGGGLTRNAVIGKVHRIPSLARRKQQPQARTWTPSPKKKMHVNKINLHSRGVTRPKKRSDIVEALLSDPTALVPPTAGCRHTIETLPADNCRWIHGDPRHPAGAEYCSNARHKLDDAQGGGKVLPYCAFHCTIAYASPELKQAREEQGQRKEHAHV